MTSGDLAALLIAVAVTSWVHAVGPATVIDHIARLLGLMPTITPGTVVHQGHHR